MLSKFKYSLLLLLSCGLQIQAQNTIGLQDISHFWQAYDRIAVTKDSVEQAAILQQFYIQPASPGLKDMIDSRHLRAGDWIKAIKRYPDFWKTIRAKTIAISTDTPRINNLMQRFQALYPAFKRPSIYFVIGNTKTGGTTSADRVLIGTEVAVADSTVTSSGMSSYLQNFFKKNQGIIYLIAHELGHTQQHLDSADVQGRMQLLGYCLREGACDFIAGLISEVPLDNPYIIYGGKHEFALWRKFEKEMDSSNTSDWLYNGGSVSDGEADLGYFMGYVICRSYYEQAKNKQAAIKDILQLNYGDSKMLHAFFRASKYSEKWR